MEYCKLTTDQLTTITGGAVCSIFDIGCVIGEAIRPVKRKEPLKCQTVGVTAYTCN